MSKIIKKIKKNKFFYMILCLLIGSGLFISWYANKQSVQSCIRNDSIPQVKILAKSVPIYDNTGKKAKIVGLAKKEDILEITEELNNWYKITTGNGIQGYIQKNNSITKLTLNINDNIIYVFVDNDVYSKGLLNFLEDLKNIINYELDIRIYNVKDADYINLYNVYREKFDLDEATPLLVINNDFMLGYDVRMNEEYIRFIKRQLNIK